MVMFVFMLWEFVVILDDDDEKLVILSSKSTDYEW